MRIATSRSSIEMTKNRRKDLITDNNAVSYRGADRNFSFCPWQGRGYLPTNREPRLISNGGRVGDGVSLTTRICRGHMLDGARESYWNIPAYVYTHVRCVIHVTRVPKFPVIVRSIVSRRVLQHTERNEQLPWQWTENALCKMARRKEASLDWPIMTPN